MEAHTETAASPCPMTRRQLIDEYFIENRTKLLDLAAFLDRLDRADEEAFSDQPSAISQDRAPNTEYRTPNTDFRMQAFQEALQALCSDTPSRITQVQMIFSDPTTEPLEKLDQKSARGAYQSRQSSDGSR
jgi:hypothetical protein